jgi:type III secretion protein S
MTPDAMESLKQALWLVLLLSGPPIVAATLVGLVIAIVQAATQVQEQTVQFLFKLVAVGAALLLSATLVAGSLMRFAEQMLAALAGVR